MEQWNNVELTNLSKKSYTLNHEYDLKPRSTTSSASNSSNINNNNNTSSSSSSDPIVTNGGGEGALAVDSAKGEGGNNSVLVAADDNSRTAGCDNVGVDGGVLQPGSDIKPKVQLQDVEALARRLYGITTSEITELISYDDRNYLIKEDRNIKNPLITTHWPHGYVLKIMNSLDSQKMDFVDAQTELMLYLSRQSVQCPKPIANVNGKYYSLESIAGTEHVVRLLEYIPGKLFHQVKVTNYLLYQSGEYLAAVDRALKCFEHPAYETHTTLWMLQSVPRLREFVYVLKDHARKQIVEEIIDSFEQNVLSQLDALEMQIIHGDYNEQNIIVQLPEGQHDYRVTGIIDFGDTHKSPVIFEVGTAMTYMMLQAKNLESGGIFLAGYNSVRPIAVEERKYLKYCVAARLAQSLTLGAYTHSLHPANEYVLFTQEEGWKLIQTLWHDSFSKIDEAWQTAAHSYLTQSGK